MRGSPRLRTAALSIAATAATLCTLAPAAFGDQQVITFAGAAIYLNDNLACQVQHPSESELSFFGTADPGSCGTYIANSSGSVYGPSSGPPSTVDHSPFSQTGVLGSGSRSDPFAVTTVVDVGSTGLRIAQTDSYVAGDEFYRTDITVSNQSLFSQDVFLYHAADCYPDEDQGYGYYDSSTGGVFCSANPSNSPPGRIQGFVPLSSGSHYFQCSFDHVWGAINGSDFPDTVDSDILQDTGAGLSWSITVPPGGSVRRSLATVVSPSGDIPDVNPQPPPTDTTPPDTPITSGPPAFGTDDTPTFTFGSTEPGSTFGCSVDGGPFLPCTSPFTTLPLPGGRHTFTVRATDAAGNTDPTPTVYIFNIAVELSDLPPPVVGEEVNVGPVAGTGPVLIAVPGQGSAARGGRAGASQKGLNFVPLTEARQVPTGSFLNTKRGTVQLVTATGSGNQTQSGRFSQGLFQVLQSRARRLKGLTDIRLKGGNFNRCRTGRRGRAGAAQVSRRTIRRNRSSTNGRYRTIAKNSAGTARGTVWITADRCDGTLTTVKRGKVAVRDFRRKKTIIVRAGKSYLAKAPR